MTNITNIRDRRVTIGDILDISGFSLPQVDPAFAAWLKVPFESLRGNEEGYNENGDIITETTDGAPLNSMWAEFQRTIRMWNQQRDALTNVLTFNVTSLIESVRYPIEQDFEEASEYGEPKGIRLGPAFRMGYDFKWWDLAIRYTWMFLAEASSQQLQALNNTALEADNRLMFTRVMRAIFNSTTRTAEIDGESVNVYPFYNGDTMVPPKWKNTTHSTGHTHYLESGTTTVTPPDVEDMIAHLTHHGYTMTRGYRLILMVNPQEGAEIREFVKGTASAKYTFIPSAGVGGGVLLAANGGIIGQPTLANLPGLETIGTYGPVTVIEEDYIPAGYMLLTATAGEDNIGNPVGIRQHENASLRGLRLVKGRDNDYPLIDSFYLHGMGTGIRHRGAGVVMEVANGGSYTVPAAYA